VNRAIALNRPKLDRERLLGLVAAVLAVVLAAHRAESVLHFLLLAGCSLLLVALAAEDAATMLLPNRLMYPGILAALLVGGLWPDQSLLATLEGGAAGFLIMLTLFVVLPGFGAGDVKLCALIGLFVGWPHVLGAILAGVTCSGLVALAGVVTRRLSLRSTMPYGPGLVAGALLVALVAHP
jgi:leader peptidase (prepilin peptidase)/N-methyltransferase